VGYLTVQSIIRYKKEKADKEGEGERERERKGERGRAGLPFDLFKGQICQIWHFLKLFARNKMVWPLGHFLAFFEC